MFILASIQPRKQTVYFKYGGFNPRNCSFIEVKKAREAKFQEATVSDVVTSGSPGVSWKLL